MKKPEYPSSNGEPFQPSETAFTVSVVYKKKIGHHDRHRVLHAYRSGDRHDILCREPATGNSDRK